tara:strand:- start:25476 stop:26297 length:822 start_codon:yes stop_codon:yes gene_type:complete
MKDIIKDKRKWQFEEFGKLPKFNNPILIEGLPGIGNVGKVAVDFLIDELEAEKLYEITSYSFPHSVFVNEDNLVELPIIEVFYKKFEGNKRDIIFLAGDVQPVDESSSYEFSDLMLDMAEKLGIKEIITTGGIGLSDIPKEPKIYCTGNSKNMIKRFKNKLVNNKIYGVVGPIVGVSGLIVGLAEKRNIEAITLLAETYGHPMYIGIMGARGILKVLGDKLGLDISFSKLDKEIKSIESEMNKKSDQMNQVTQSLALKKLRRKLGGEPTDYIG